jgi:sterol desaturase/sphingolipid hydroxylase (fatty acid hydroxylase superfamily)
MIVLNVSFGIYAFLPQGWILMIAIILIECLGLSYFLTKKIKNKKIYNTVIISNIISGIVGIIGSMILNGGWWLVVWLPWVSSNEVSSKNGFKTFVIFYLIAFLLTIIIEGIVNYLMLKKEYPSFQILKMTLLVNSISYLLGSLAMYTYSF